MLDQAETPKGLGKKLRELLNIPDSLPPDLARLVALLEKQERANKCAGLILVAELVAPEAAREATLRRC